MRKSFSLAVFFFSLYFPGMKHNFKVNKLFFHASSNLYNLFFVFYTKIKLFKNA